ncbi:NAD/NADP octopine/nopaline dehydrogenase family protein [Bacteroides sp. 224]|uniref:NAD/NADP octopine/nopaline dehydrogenase family protein n=1 Tax=Bacteroides sp. 224 TaxID=2302936 RepID=UPI0013D6D4E0|nr:NAD/NADP octopine/nopaline dehydrogenase family protein [Bacteroides sp. 224]NDV63726.1 NAD/NADP octopine/nopaline dehydrogenase [Bacteroides sp. 224]
MSVQVCICGGGALGHVIAGYLGSKPGYKVHVLTSRPEQWSNTLLVNDCEGKQFRGDIHLISSDPETVIPGSNIVLLCLPGYAIENVLSKIKPWLNSSIMVGSVVSSTGFFFIAHRVLEGSIPLFGFQRTPFICRVDSYGTSANLLGYKKQLQLATLRVADTQQLALRIENMFDTPVVLLDSFLEVSFTNSNPLLHPSRLYTLFGQDEKGRVYDTQPGFYSDWDNEASEMLIACDKEFYRVLDKLPVDKNKIPTILAHYESSGVESLTQKLRSIPAFANIKVPMKKTEVGFVLDFNNRYFTEDFLFGLLILKSVAEAVAVKTPHIDSILYWGQMILNKTYLNEQGELIRENLSDTGYVSPEVLKEIITSNSQ